jgi:hypothetical protein
LADSEDREMASGPARVSPPDRRPVRQLGRLEPIKRIRISVNITCG